MKSSLCDKKRNKRQTEPSNTALRERRNCFSVRASAEPRRCKIDQASI